jgi:tripartite-type tricarboxylate transporter receptor subunit TctC
MADFLPGYEASAWFGLGAPKNTPAKIVDTLNSEVNAGLADPKLKARPADLCSSAFVISPGDFGNFIAEDTEKRAKIKFANIQRE